METIGKGVSGSPSVSGVLEDEPQDSRRRSSRVAKSVTKIPKRASPYSAKQPAVKKKTVAVVAKKEADWMKRFGHDASKRSCSSETVSIPMRAASKTSYKSETVTVSKQDMLEEKTPDDSYKLLTADFYACDALDLAPRLLGKLLRHDDVILKITEVEAYRQGDTACHARFGRTARTEAMFRAGGHAYLFLCYGTNVMLNVVADKDGVGAAVLIRACSPVAGLTTILQRRKQSAVKPVLLSGPGKVGQALGLTKEWSCHPLYLPGGLELLDGPAPEAILAGPRVGIDYATPQDVAAPWRFAAAGTPWVSAPRATLLPIQWTPDTILSDQL